MECGRRTTTGKRYDFEGLERARIAGLLLDGNFDPSIDRAVFRGVISTRGRLCAWPCAMNRYLGISRTFFQLMDHRNRTL